MSQASQVIEELVIKTTIDDKEFTQGYRRIVTTINNASKQVENTNKKTEKSLKNIDKQLNKMNNTVSLAKRIWATLKIGNFLGASAYASMEMIENQNLFKVAMGDNLKVATDFVYALERAYTLPVSESMRYMGMFKQMSQAMGLAENEAYELSKGFTALTSDLASFFNITTEEAFVKLRAGLAGESEPLRRLGILTTEISLREEALRIGVTKNIKAMSEREKMMLRYIAIMRQSNNAIGDFSRTMDSPSNQIKILQNNFKNLSISIGNSFMGMLGYVLPVINGFLIALRRVADTVASFFGYKAPDIKPYKTQAEGIGEIGDEADKSAKKVKSLKNLMSFDELNTVSDGTGVSGGASDVGGMNPDIQNAFMQSVEEANKRFQKAMDDASSKAKEIADKITEYFKPVGEVFGFFAPDLVLIFKDIGEKLAKIGEYLLPFMSGALSGFVAVLTFTLSGLALVLDIILTAVEFILKVIPPDVLNAIGVAVGVLVGMWVAFSVIMAIVNGAMVVFAIVTKASPIGWLELAVIALIAVIVLLWKNWDTISKFFIDAWDTVKTRLGEIWNAITSGLSESLGLMKKKWIEIWNGVKSFGEGIWNGMKNGVTGAWNTAKDTLTKTWNGIKTAFTTVWDAIKSVGTTVFDKIKEKYTGVFDGLKTYLKGIITFITGVFSGDWKKAWEGIKTAFSGIVGVFGTLFEAPINKIIDALNFLIKGLNKIKIETPDWFPGGKKTFGIDIPVIGHVQLARGGMVSPGTFFEAGEGGKAEVMGNYNGKTTVMPLENTSFVDAMRKAVAQGIIDGASSTGGQQIILKLDDINLGKGVVKSLNKLSRLEGGLAIEI